MLPKLTRIVFARSRTTGAWVLRGPTLLLTAGAEVTAYLRDGTTARVKVKEILNSYPNGNSIATFE